MRTSCVLLFHELPRQYTDAHEVHQLSHHKEVVVVLNHQPHKEENLRAHSHYYIKPSMQFLLKFTSDAGERLSLAVETNAPSA